MKPFHARRVLLTLAALVLAVAAGEIAARLSGFASPHLYDPVYARFAGTSEIAYVHKPDLVDARGRGFARFHTDELGLRSTVPGRRWGPKAPGEVRIAVLGDSGTFGEGVARTEDTFPQVLEDLLDEERRDGAVRVLNFGTSAYSVREMTATLEHRALALDPDVVILVLIPHDFVLARTPTVDATGYLADRREDGEPRRTQLALRLLGAFHLSYVVRGLVDAWWTTGRDAMSAMRHGELPASYEHVQRFAALARAHGRRHLVVLRPSFHEQPFPALPAALERDRIPFLDLSGMRAEFSDENFRASRFDSHPSAAVHRRIAEALAERLRADGFLDGAEPRGAAADPP